jgi:hypothetical protein
MLDFSQPQEVEYLELIYVMIVLACKVIMNG